MSARIKIGISVYNDSEYLDMLLQSIRWYTMIDEPYDLVVCDDGSREEHIVSIREVCNKYGAILIENDGNCGIPTTWNHLVRAIDNTAEIIVLLNNDLLVVPQWLQVAVHFLDRNRDNPNVGSCFWNPVNRVPKDMMKSILPHLGSTLFYTKDTVSGEEPDFLSGGPMEVQVGEGQGLGRVMCPCGAAFCVRRQVFDEVGLFDERLISFHEESSFGTACAQIGRASFGFAYPRPYHTHGATFAVNPELKAGERMADSRRLYRQIWGVPKTVSPDGYFEYVHNKFMTNIPPTKLRYLRPVYDQGSIEVKRPGGETIQMPKLVEFEEEF